MSARASGRTRSTKKLEADTASLTRSDKLLVAQAVFEYGDAWAEIAEKLAQHSLISRPASFTPQSCQMFYVHLMKEAEMEITDENSQPKNPVNRKLAEQLFQERLQELKDLIAAEEATFQEKTREIAEIRAGKWDDQILGTAVSPSPSPTPQAETPPPAAIKEVTPPPSSPSALPDEPEPEVEVEVEPAPDMELDEKDEDGGDAGPGISPEVIVIDDGSEHGAPEHEELANEPTEDEVLTTPAEEGAEPEMEADNLEEDEEDGSERGESPVARSRKRKESPGEDSPQDSKRIRDESEAPEDDDEALSAAPSTRGRRANAAATPADKKFQGLILGLHQQIHQHKCGAIFHQPIKPSDALDYHSIIHHPIDLKTIKARVRAGEISSSLEYRRDIALMFANAMMFNRPSSDVYKMAEEMNNDVDHFINDFRQTEDFHGRGR